MNDALPAPRVPVRLEAEPRMRSAFGVDEGKGRDDVRNEGKWVREKSEKSG